MLRACRADEWSRWFEAAGVTEPPHHRGGIVFDASLAVMGAAVQAAGVALAPPLMFARQLEAGAIARPFATKTVLGGYWLTYPQARLATDAMLAFRDRLFGTVELAESVETVPRPLQRCGDHEPDRLQTNPTRPLMPDPVRSESRCRPSGVGS